MKTTLIGLSLAALAFGGAAVAQKAPAPANDGVVTRAEAQACAGQMFADLDVNKDGRLNQADRDARMARMFDRIDTNPDGSVSRDEFMAHHAGGAEGHPRMGGMGHGEMGDGGMNHGGMHAGMGGGRMGMMMLRMADADKDGAVSQAEFTAAVLSHFDQADANKDGRVTPEERRAAQQAMRVKMRGMMGPGGMGPGAMGSGPHAGHDMAPPAAPPAGK